jgi:hypothetical protein
MPQNVQYGATISPTALREDRLLEGQLMRCRPPLQDSGHAYAGSQRQVGVGGSYLAKALDKRAGEKWRAACRVTVVRI